MHIQLQDVGFTGNMVIRDDGKMVLGLAKENNKQFGVMRLNANGSPDETFGEEGLVFTNLTIGSLKDDFVRTVLIQPDGKIIAAGVAGADNGYYDEAKFALVRYLSDGMLDTSFNGTGKAIFPINDYGADAQAAVLQTDGKILVTGIAWPQNSENRVAMIRVNTNGTIDSSFGTNGLVITSINCEATNGTAIAINDHNIYVGGSLTVYEPFYNSQQSVISYLYDVCEKPESGFTAAANNLTVSFTDQSNDADSWQWDFGDGYTSSEPSPLHTYEDEGTYETKLITGNTCGADTAVNEITVCAALNTDFQYLTSGLVYYFNNQVTEADTFSWDFGDGTVSTEQTTWHTFATSGTYNVCLTEYDACTSQVFCQSIVVCGPLTTEFSYTASGLSYQFNDVTLNAVTWNWDFGDGTSSIEANPFHVYPGIGLYEICLITGNGCTYDTLCQTINIIATSANSIEAFNNVYTVFPNPFSTTTTILFSIQVRTPLNVDLLDLQGRIVETVITGNFEAGDHEVGFSRENLPAGIYLLQLKTDWGIQTKKLIIQ